MPSPKEKNLHTPCDACPWRTANQSRRHHAHFYTKRNLERLWNGIRRGNSMTCHPTDPSHPDHGAKDGATTLECSGAVLVAARELYFIARLTEPDFYITPEAIDAYEKVAAARKGFTKLGLHYWIVKRQTPPPFGDGRPLPPIPPDLITSDDFARPMPKPEAVKPPAKTPSRPPKSPTTP